MKSFIGEYIFDDVSVCDDIIDYYNKSNKKFQGLVADGTEKVVVDINKKNSTECLIEDEILTLKYNSLLQNCLEQYMEEYEYAAAYSRIVLAHNHFKIKYYQPKQGYFDWHCERIGPTTARRHLSFLTYLNDVPDGGTEFYYQQSTIKAVKGKTVIWPVDWTFTHRGQISQEHEKYIISGYYRF